jgi:transcription elongation factor GreA
MSETRAPEITVLTPQGLERLRAELEGCKHRLQAMVEHLKQLRGSGENLGESSEFIAIKAEQALLEQRARRLEALLDRAHVLQPGELCPITADIGAEVVLEELGSGRQLTIQLVSPAESDVENRKISTESPVGQALRGCRPGDTIEVATPTGRVRYKVVSCSRGEPR